MTVVVTHDSFTMVLSALFREKAGYRTISNLYFFLFRDEGVHWGIQNGLFLSRSTIIYFKHNNMESLRDTLEKVTRDNKRAKKLRRYIVVEAVYQVTFIQYGLFVSAIFYC